MFTIVYDHHEGPKGLRTAWGFSSLLEGFAKTVLFDTGGDGDILLHNLHRIHTDPGRIDAVVLSHSDWDHTGGLRALLGENPDIMVFMPRTFPEELKTSVQQYGSQLVETADATEVCADITTTPVLGESRPEQGLCVRTTAGTVLITGCAHPGIADMVHEARNLTGGAIYAALGGFHLKDSWATDINFTIARLKELGLRQVGPCHCSGEEARGRMADAFGDDYLSLNVGTRIPFEPASDSQGIRHKQ